MSRQPASACVKLTLMDKSQEPSSALILGVDPGTCMTGYGLINAHHKVLDYGCIKPPKKAPLELRYKIIFQSIQGLIDRYQPTALAVETQFVSKNVASAMKLGMARGVIMVAASLKGVPVFEYAPTKVKLAIVGKGRASKQQIQYMIKKLLQLAVIPEPEDAADALAIALCHLHQSKKRCYVRPLEGRTHRTKRSASHC